MVQKKAAVCGEERCVTCLKTAAKETTVLLSRYVCSYIKTNGLLQYQTRTTEGFFFFFFFFFFLECTSSEYY